MSLTPEQEEQLCEFVWGKSPHGELIAYVNRLILEGRLEQWEICAHYGVNETQRRDLIRQLEALK